MVQMVIISLLLYFVASVILAEGALKDRIPFCRDLAAYFSEKPITKLIWGILTIITGVFKLFPAFTGQIAVVGDLLPVLAGLCLGSLLVADFFYTRSSKKEPSYEVEGSEGEDEFAQEPKIVKRVGKNFLMYRTGIGLGGIGVVILHFFLYQIIFL